MEGTHRRIVGVAVSEAAAIGVSAGEDKLLRSGTCERYGKFFVVESVEAIGACGNIRWRETGCFADFAGHIS